MRDPDEAFRDGLRRQIVELDTEIAKCKQRLAYLRQVKGETLEKLVGVSNEMPTPEHIRRSL